MKWFSDNSSFYRRWSHLFREAQTRNGLLGLLMLIGFGLVAVAFYLNFPPVWFYLPESQRNAGSCGGLDCTNPDVVRGAVIFLPFAPALFMKFEGIGWNYYLLGTEKQFRLVLKVIGFAGVSSSGLELVSALARLNLQLLCAGLLSLLSLPLLRWMVRNANYIREREYGSLSRIDFLFLGFLYATFLPLSTVFFFPSLFFVGMADFAILLVGCPAFTHLRIGISARWLAESSYGL